MRKEPPKKWSPVKVNLTETISKGGMVDLQTSNLEEFANDSI